MKTTLLLTILTLTSSLSAAPADLSHTGDSARALGMLIRDVPEPSSLAILIGLGFLVVTVLRKQREKQAALTELQLQPIAVDSPVSFPAQDRVDAPIAKAS